MKALLPVLTVLAVGCGSSEEPAASTPAPSVSAPASDAPASSQGAATSNSVPPAPSGIDSSQPFSQRGEK